MVNLDNDFSRFVESYKIPTIQLSARVKPKVYDAENPLPTTATPEAVTVPSPEVTTGVELDWSNKSDRSKILDAQQFAESNYNPKAESNLSRASKYRAKGVSQFMDATWKEWAPEGSSPFDEDVASDVQHKYMDYISKRPYISSAKTASGRTRRMLAGYNSGIGNVQKAVNAATEAGDPTKWMDYMKLAGEAKYAEVQDYVPKIYDRASAQDYKPRRTWDYSRKLGGILYKRSFNFTNNK